MNTLILPLTDLFQPLTYFFPGKSNLLLYLPAYFKIQYLYIYITQFYLLTSLKKMIMKRLLLLSLIMAFGTKQSNCEKSTS
ncbi:MAG: hypothetical protein B6D61_14885 [Bacteroidetes bacterium 4484_249]|nr:MAG: hypothetical protein B6D61_14885 [Bacteroidetes bacterium 4484_249]